MQCRDGAGNFVPANLHVNIVSSGETSGNGGSDNSAQLAADSQYMNQVLAALSAYYRAHNDYPSIGDDSQGIDHSIFNLTQGLVPQYISSIDQQRFSAIVYMHRCDSQGTPCYINNDPSKGTGGGVIINNFDFQGCSSGATAILVFLFNDGMLSDFPLAADLLKGMVGGSGNMVCLSPN